MGTCSSENKLRSLASKNPNYVPHQYSHSNNSKNSFTNVKPADDAIALPNDNLFDFQLEPLSLHYLFPTTDVSNQFKLDIDVIFNGNSKTFRHLSLGKVEQNEIILTGLFEPVGLKISNSKEQPAIVKVRLSVFKHLIKVVPSIYGEGVINIGEICGDGNKMLKMKTWTCTINDYENQYNICQIKFNGKYKFEDKPQDVQPVPRMNKMTYDFQMNINSFEGLITKGWEIIRNPYIDTTRLKDVLVIGILGYVNSGKTYVLKQLFPSKVLTPSEFQGHGLSTKLVFFNMLSQIISNPFEAHKTLLFFDPIGADCPLDKSQNSNLTILASDFIQDFIINTCEIAIYVTNLMNCSELNFIKQKLVKSKVIKAIILIHNFNHINTLEEFSNLCQYQIKEHFETSNEAFKDQDSDGATTILKKKKKKCYYFFTNGDVPIYHFPIALENSQIGKEINEANFAKILQIFLGIEAFRTVNIETLLKNNLANYIISHTLLRENTIHDTKNLIKITREMISIDKDQVDEIRPESFVMANDDEYSEIFSSSVYQYTCEIFNNQLQVKLFTGGCHSRFVSPTAILNSTHITVTFKLINIYHNLLKGEKELKQQEEDCIFTIPLVYNNRTYCNPYQSEIKVDGLPSEKTDYILFNFPITCKVESYNSYFYRNITGKMHDNQNNFQLPLGQIVFGHLHDLFKQGAFFRLENESNFYTAKERKIIGILTEENVSKLEILSLLTGGKQIPVMKYTDKSTLNFIEIESVLYIYFDYRADNYLRDDEYCLFKESCEKMIIGVCDAVFYVTCHMRQTQMKYISMLKERLAVAKTTFVILHYFLQEDLECVKMKIQQCIIEPFEVSEKNIMISRIEVIDSWYEYFYIDKSFPFVYHFVLSKAQSLSSYFNLTALDQIQSILMLKCFPKSISYQEILLQMIDEAGINTHNDGIIYDHYKNTIRYTQGIQMLESRRIYKPKCKIQKEYADSHTILLRVLIEKEGEKDSLSIIEANVKQDLDCFYLHLTGEKKIFFNPLTFIACNMAYGKVDHKIKLLPYSEKTKIIGIEKKDRLVCYFYLISFLITQ